nr:MAG: major capsid protein [Microvirus sp.]
MKSNLTTQERFSEIESQSVARSTFDRSFGHKTTMDAGKLYPLYWDFALPGDTFKVKPTIFGRFATPLKPIMDNVYVDTHFFSVPYRLVYDNFKKLMGEQKNPGDSTNFTIPMMTSPAGGYQEMSIYDYLGIPTKVSGVKHMSLLLRAYNLIYNEWYRDEDIQDSIPFNTGDEIDLHTDYDLLWRNKRKDYFTSARPWAQKSQPVSIPIAQEAKVFAYQGGANVFENGLMLRKSNLGAQATWEQGSVDKFTAGSTAATWTTTGANKTGTLAIPTKSGDNSMGGGGQGGESTLYADLSEATNITINAFREAVSLQQFFELDARGGTRYTETIKAHFNVTSPDARLQRPEYLGGSSVPLTINPIAQQSASVSGETPQGNLAAIGTISSSGNGFVKTFTEHEIIIGLVSIRADLNYQYGLNRLLSHETRFDFYWPSFANLGEQAILNKELKANGTASDNEVFGYQERYSEYRYRPSQITGLFRSNATNSLDVWHLAQEYTGVPALNDAFLRENPPIDRVIAVPSEPQFIIDAFFDNVAARPMPVRSTPGLTRL